MADNVDITPGSGKSIAADDIGGVLHQRVKVVIGADGASDGDVSETNKLPVVSSNATSNTTAVTQVSSSASSVMLLDSNSDRKGAAFFNDSTQVLYIKLGTTASATSYTVRMGAGAYYELPAPIYIGRIDGIWASANGSALITEFE
jgi:hypothetical protein